MKLTLWGDCAVQRISKDEQTFTRATAVSFQHIDGFDGVAEASFTICHAHCIGCIDDHVSKEIRVSDQWRQESSVQV